MYYVYDVEWSQTDKDTVCFYCANGNPAQFLKSKYPKARYYNLIRKIEPSDFYGK